MCNVYACVSFNKISDGVCHSYIVHQVKKPYGSPTVSFNFKHKAFVR